MTVKHRLQGELGITAQVIMLRQEKFALSPTHIHVAVCGEVDSGKSTLISVIVTGNFDNGHGMARNRIVRYNHELESGRTSSISHHSACFSNAGEILSHSNHQRVRALSDIEIAEQTHRIIIFQDLAGHEKYFKTALHGFLGREPDICLLTISSTRGIQSMTREYLGVAVALKIPLVIVITKNDLATEKGVLPIVKDVNSLLKAAGRRSILINDDCHNFHRDETLTVPIFQVSCVTGSGLNELKHYLFKLPSQQRRWDELKLLCLEIRVLEQYRVDNSPNEDQSSPYYNIAPRSKRSRSFANESGSAVIVLGMVKSGVVTVGDVLLYGPDKAGTFVSVIVNSVQINRVPVRAASAGQCATLLLRRRKDPDSLDDDTLNFSGALSATGSTDALTALESDGSTTEGVYGQPREDDEWTEDDNSVVNEIWAKRVGLVLLSPLTAPRACWGFQAEVFVLNHPSTIRINYEPVVHAENIMQSARLCEIHHVCRKSKALVIHEFIESNGGLKVGDKAVCSFRFLYQPEFLQMGIAIVLREGRTRGVGRVVKPLY